MKLLLFTPIHFKYNEIEESQSKQVMALNLTSYITYCYMLCKCNHMNPKLCYTLPRYLNLKNMFK